MSGKHEGMHLEEFSEGMQRYSCSLAGSMLFLKDTQPLILEFEMIFTFLQVLAQHIFSISATAKSLGWVKLSA